MGDSLPPSECVPCATVGACQLTSPPLCGIIEEWSSF